MSYSFFVTWSSKAVLNLIQWYTGNKLGKNGIWTEPISLSWTSLHSQRVAQPHIKLGNTFLGQIDTFLGAFQWPAVLTQWPISTRRAIRDVKNAVDCQKFSTLRSVDCFVIKWADNHTKWGWWVFIDDIVKVSKQGFLFFGTCPQLGRVQLKN